MTSRPGRAVIGGLPRSYWLLWFAILVNRLGTFVVPFLYLYLTRTQQMSVARAALTVALYGIGSTFSGPVGGLLADRLGRRQTLILGQCAGAVAMATLGLVHVPAVLPALTLVVGFVGELYRPAASAMIADVVGPELRVRAYGLLHWANNLGFAVGLLLAGVMAERSFLLLFLGDAATTLLCAAIVWCWVAESRPTFATPSGRALGALVLPLRDRRFAAIWLLAMLTASIYFQFATTLPEALARHGITLAEYGTLTSLTCLVITVVQPFAPALLQRAPRAQVLAAACLLIAVGFGAVGVFSTLPQFMVAALIWTFGEIGYVAVMPSMVAALAPPERRGGYQGCYQMAWGLASFAGPALGGLVLQRLGAGWLWGGCFVLGVCLAIGHHAVVTAE
jgi:MFS family permease